MLRANISKRLGSFSLNVELTAEPRKTLVLVGESGAGKSSVLNLLAGLMDPDTGRITVGDITYFDSETGVAVPTHKRSIGYVFQDLALFPHLSIFENVAFGLRAQGRVDSAVKRRVSEVLEQVGASQLSDAGPNQLSGGQQQRVALARALVLEPELLLLDEPLSALDIKSRRSVRTELRRILSQLPCVALFVTHTPFEAMLFGNQIAVIAEGRIAQSGTRDELLKHPRSRYVAELVGLNFFHGRVAARDGSGFADIETPEGVLHVVNPGEADEVFVAVDPREITLHTSLPSGTARNVFHGRIIELVPEPPLGERIRVSLDTHPPLVAEITAHAVNALSLNEGIEVYASFKATGARGYE